MKKWILLSIAMLFAGNLFARDVESETTDCTSVTLNSDNYVKYTISNKETVDMNNDGYIDRVNFKVNWVYSGSLSLPHIVYIVTIKEDNVILDEFQDSAIGEFSGSRSYSIDCQSRLSENDGWRITIGIVGSDGSHY
ncbi:hypothetical protein [Parabacteroides sp. An277]|uniref:hypothetical protein n=1 Tax=Parabacteroides sp. An277 TaxID=1965619 RepID=UPI001122384D|nr:hypothetical protein [Parabacteroides sp. An277]